MRFANVRELRLETNKVLSLTKERGPVVLTRRGRPIAVLSAINEEDLSLNKTAGLWSRIKDAAQRSGYGPQDIEKLIKETRKSVR